jgi:hypothetical protein
MSHRQVGGVSVIALRGTRVWSGSSHIVLA